MTKHASNSCKNDDDFAIVSRRVVTPLGESHLAVIVGNEKIRKIVAPEQVPEGVAVVDFGDLIISPGIVDAHVHVNEPGRTEWEGFSSATQAAAAGGVTTIIDMPLNSSPVTTNVGSLKAKRSAAAGKCHVDVGFYGGLVPGNHNELAGLVDAGVLGVKAFMCDSGLDEFPAAGISDLKNAMQFLGGSGVPLLAHAELINEDAAVPTDVRSYRQYVDSRPPEFELDAIEALIELCRQFETPVHVVHLATALALPMLKTAKEEGLSITVETCPHYLHFCSEEIDDGATSFKCAPPIRDNANRALLCKAVSEGLIETIGSDHSPTLPELKSLEAGDFSVAWGGIAGLQLTLPVVWTVGKDYGWSPTMLAKRLSERPAEIFGLSGRKGKIEVGYDADFVVWDPNEQVKIDGSQLHHRHAVTPYDDRELVAAVKATYVRGRLVYSEMVVDNEPVGTLLVRGEDASKYIADHFNELGRQSDDLRTVEFEKCCASKTWVSRMEAHGNFENDIELIACADASWTNLNESDFLEAFSAHPRIGNVETLREKFANTKTIARGEQAGVDLANEMVIQRLAAANDEYYEKFGFIFIVCATGKSAEEMLAILESRLSNERDAEIEIAAAEQIKITRIRLRKIIA